MNKKIDTRKSVADHKLDLPPCMPALMAVRMAAVLMPPRPDMNTSRGIEPCISRRTRLRKDIGAMSSVYTFTTSGRRPSDGCAWQRRLTDCAANGDAIRRELTGLR